jgi:hypothetical protein
LKKDNIHFQNKLPKLLVCILLDTVGYVSYLLPILGETEDILWAPVSAIIFFVLFGRKKFGILGGVFSFIEEISPGLDFIPTFTIAWFIKKYEMKTSSKLIKIG